MWLGLRGAHCQLTQGGKTEELFPKLVRMRGEAFISRVKGVRTSRESGPWVSATTLVEKRTRVVEDVDLRKTPRPHSCLRPSTTPPSLHHPYPSQGPPAYRFAALGQILA